MTIGGTVIVVMKLVVAVTEATVTLADVTGKIIYRQKTQLIVGRNELELGFKVKPGVMLLKVDSGKVNYGVSKIIFR